MELVTVRIKGLVATNRYGTLSIGDLLRTDAAFARHLVEDCAAAEYVTTRLPPAPGKRQARKAKRTTNPAPSLTI